MRLESERFREQRRRRLSFVPVKTPQLENYLFPAETQSWYLFNVRLCKPIAGQYLSIWVCRRCDRVAALLRRSRTASCWNKRYFPWNFQIYSIKYSVRLQGIKTGFLEGDIVARCLDFLFYFYKEREERFFYFSSFLQTGNFAIQSLYV